MTTKYIRSLSCRKVIESIRLCPSRNSPMWLTCLWMSPQQPTSLERQNFFHSFEHLVHVSEGKVWLGRKLVPDSSKCELAFPFAKSPIKWSLVITESFSSALSGNSDRMFRSIRENNFTREHKHRNQDAAWRAIDRSIVVTHYLYVQARNGKEKFTFKNRNASLKIIKHRIVSDV